MVGEGVLRWLYSKEESVLALCAVQAQASDVEQELAVYQKNIQELEDKRLHDIRTETREKQNIQKEREQLEKKEQQELNATKTKLQTAMAQFNTRRQKLNDEETAELSKLQATIGGKIAVLQRQINSADQTLTDELQTALQKIQRNYIDNYLSRTMISSASIAGIGEKFTLRLKRHGIYSAADVDYSRVQRVEGIGDTRAQSLCDWRKDMERLAKSSMPSHLPTSEDAAIRHQHRQKKNSLVTDKDAHEQQRIREDNNIRIKFDLRRAQVDKEKTSAQSASTQESQHISERYRKSFDDLEQKRVNNDSMCLRKIHQIEADIQKVRKDASATNWESAKVRRELEAYRDINFKRYRLRAIAFLKR